MYYFSVVVIKYPEQGQLGGERVNFGLWFPWDRVHSGTEGVVEHRNGGRSRKLANRIFIHPGSSFHSHRKHIENRKQMYKYSKSTLSDVLPPASLHFLKVHSIALPNSANNW